MAHVLHSRDLLARIFSFQWGLHEDMLVFQSLLSSPTALQDPAHVHTLVSKWLILQRNIEQSLHLLVEVMPSMRVILAQDAIYAGNVGYLSRLHALFDLRSLQTPLMDVAARFNRLEILQALHAVPQHDYGCTSRAVFDACSHGHVQVVEFLFRELRSLWSLKAAACAAKRGHLHIIEWIFERRAPMCMVQALKGAASHGHLEVVKYLIARDTTGGSGLDALVYAAKGGHFHVVEFIYETILIHESADSGFPFFAAALCYAINGGHDAIVAYLTSKSEPEFMDDMDLFMQHEVYQPQEAKRLRLSTHLIA
ncbi:unnamed protein product [Aphanomyces euteiches]|uniref:Uncharacterized protein n=1 Tax=Aphanomyces euteiches TaxID=100861 RepID=A0A6G0WFP7_9STRA|nr:hypothetical protein Ae201684_016251 [Aphanomyces euteiches]KAH9095281.1 hypothetical protein Ae201684P_013397 [Aphanomyces euteiches]KAH9142137.1 hypothetical protein AeRB84_013772 [Aphanomyces euteiches]